MFESRVEERIEEWRILHNEELLNFWSLQNIIRVPN
jgi:hypothetical protein